MNFRLRLLLCLGIFKLPQSHKYSAGISENSPLHTVLLNELNIHPHVF